MVVLAYMAWPCICFDGRRLAGGRKPSFSFHGERDALTHSEDDIFKTGETELRCWMGESGVREWRGQERQTGEKNLCCPYFLIFPAELGSVVKTICKEG